MVVVLHLADVKGLAQMVRNAAAGNHHAKIVIGGADLITE